MSIELSPMAYGDIRLVSFKWDRWLTADDALTGTPLVVQSTPLLSAVIVGNDSSEVVVAVTAGDTEGLAQLKCTVDTVLGERATRSVRIQVKPRVP